MASEDLSSPGGRCLYVCRDCTAVYLRYSSPDNCVACGKGEDARFERVTHSGD